MSGRTLLSICLITACCNAFATSPCEVVLCMTQPGEKECRAAEQKFFSIAYYDGDGDFVPSATANLRRRYLNQCGTAAPAFINQIISRFGYCQ